MSPLRLHLHLHVHWQPDSGRESARYDEAAVELVAVRHTPRLLTRESEPQPQYELQVSLFAVLNATFLSDAHAAALDGAPFALEFLTPTSLFSTHSKLFFALALAAANFTELVRVDSASTRLMRTVRSSALKKALLKWVRFQVFFHVQFNGMHFVFENWSVFWAEFSS